jgi:hypothetical protein
MCKAVGNVPKDNLGDNLVVNARMELCGGFINNLNVTLFNYTVEAKQQMEMNNSIKTSPG